MAKTAARGRGRGNSRSWGERQAIGALARLLEGGAPGGRPPSGGTRTKLGIGDDAAVLEPGRGLLVWTVDACVEGVHFRREWLTLEDVGWRALQAAVSDVAAMAARPMAALSSLVLPPRFGRRDLEALGRGQAVAARALGCPVVGGNIARGDQLSITTTVLGEAEHPRRRDGARPGDELWLVGDVGAAAAGLHLLRRATEDGSEPGGRHSADRFCIEAWRRPRALVAQGLELAATASAVIDVSDGLGGDARHLAEASRARILIDADRLGQALRPELLHACAGLGVDPLELALRGGEDYALLATGSRRQRPSFAAPIGRVTRGHGVALRPAGGGPAVPVGEGYDHLARE